MCHKSSSASEIPLFLFLVLWCFLALPMASARQYTVVNNCPDPIDAYYIASWEAYLYPQTSFTKELGDSTGFFYTVTNGGNTAGEATRVAFYSNNGANQYYIVKDWNSFNTGVRVQPSQPEINGYCPPVTCDAVTCTTAGFEQPPALKAPSNGEPPIPPLYACPYPNLSYTITFCPSGSFPGDAGRGAAIHPISNPNKCIDVRGAIYADGTPVQVYDCNGTGAQKWVYNKDFTKIRVAGTNYCLDSGSSTRNGAGLKIWTCYDHLGAQEWFAGSNNQLIREGTGFCLDLPKGVLTNGNQLQTWECAQANTNQLWTKGA